MPKFDAVSMMWKLWAQGLAEFTTAGMDDLSASLHYSGERADEKETEIAQAWVQG